MSESYLPATVSPKDVLFPKQRAFIDDQSQYKIGVTTRQWGKSTVTSGESVHDCLIDPGTKWVCMSAGERQSVEWLNKAKEWQQAYKLVIEDVAEDRGGIAEGLLKSTEILFHNGSRIIAIPANPHTARGYSANTILDEFAYHENPNAIWAAMFPSTTNALAGTFLDRFRAIVKGEDTTHIRRDLKLRVVSTFNGRTNKFFQLWEDAAKNGYSAHLVTIHDAIADGMPLDAAKLKAALDDAEAWEQEYECIPSDVSTVLLTYELIATCESADATVSVASDFWSVTPPFPLVMGIDFARKRDLTVAWTDQLLGNVAQCKEVLELEKMPTPQQVEVLRPRIKQASRVCFDYTGPGIGMGDYLVDEFGEYNPAQDKYGKIELCTFTPALKVEIFTKLRMSFEQRTRRIPINVKIREDLHSVERVVSNNGNVSYRAPHSEDGHADRCTALALAERARNYVNGPFSFQAVKKASAWGQSEADAYESPFRRFKKRFF